MAGLKACATETLSQGKEIHMIPRRRFIETTALAGALGIAPAAEAQQAPPARVGDTDLRPVVEALSQIRTELAAHRAFAELSPVRDPQRQFLKQNGKLPDFIEVGSDIWFAIHDWHVRWQQPVAVGQDPSGRYYTIGLLRTVVIMRQDLPDRFVGLPYDTPR
jgi:hypothetical protein